VLAKLLTVCGLPFHSQKMSDLFKYKSSVITFLETLGKLVTFKITSIQIISLQVLNQIVTRTFTEDNEHLLNSLISSKVAQTLAKTLAQQTTSSLYSALYRSLVTTVKEFSYHRVFIDQMLPGTCLILTSNCSSDLIQTLSQLLLNASEVLEKMGDSLSAEPDQSSTGYETYELWVKHIEGNPRKQELLSLATHILKQSNVSLTVVATRLYWRFYRNTVAIESPIQSPSLQSH
jgi:hypothetical protein